MIELPAPENTDPIIHEGREYVLRPLTVGGEAQWTVDWRELSNGMARGTLGIFDSPEAARAHVPGWEGWDAITVTIVR